MVESISDGKAKESNGLTPICRLKYIGYTLIDFLIFSMLIDTKNDEDVLIALVVNSLIILPILVTKRAKDIGFSIPITLTIWYSAVISQFFSVLSAISIFLIIPNGILQIYLILTKGKYDKFSVNWQRVREVLFLKNYISNIGVWRLCFVLGILFSITFFFVFSRWGFKHWDWVLIDIEWNNIRNAIIGFYVPFIISVIIQWVYNGFKSNT